MINMNVNLIIRERKNSLWLGNIESPQDEEFMNKNNIKVVFNITKKQYPEFTKVKYYYVELSDADNPAEMKKFLNVVDQTIESVHDELKKNNVLIHCEMGIQRSAAIVGAYLIKYYGMNPDEAVSFIRDRRNVAFKHRVTFLEPLYKLYHKYHHLL